MGPGKSLTRCVVMCWSNARHAVASCLLPCKDQAGLPCGAWSCFQTVRSHTAPVQNPLPQTLCGPQVPGVCGDCNVCGFPDGANGDFTCQRCDCDQRRTAARCATWLALHTGSEPCSLQLGRFSDHHMMLLMQLPFLFAGCTVWLTTCARHTFAPSGHVAPCCRSTGGDDSRAVVAGSPDLSVGR